MVRFFIHRPLLATTIAIVVLASAIGFRVPVRVRHFL